MTQPSESGSDFVFSVQSIAHDPKTAHARFRKNKRSTKETMVVMKCNTSVDLLSWGTLLQAAVWLANGGQELNTGASVVREETVVPEIVEDVAEEVVEQVYIPTVAERVSATVDSLEDTFFSMTITSEDQMNALGGRSLLKDLYTGLGFEIARTNAKSKRGTAGEWIVITSVRSNTLADSCEASVGSVLTKIDDISVITMTYIRVNQLLEQTMTQGRATKKDVKLEFRRAVSERGTLFKANKPGGRNLKWIRQYVQLNGGILYFSDGEKKKPNRTLDLGGCTVHLMKAEDVENHRKFCLRVDEEDGISEASALIQCEEDGENGIVPWASILIHACDVASGGRNMRHKELLREEEIRKEKEAFARSLEGRILLEAELSAKQEKEKQEQLAKEEEIRRSEEAKKAEESAYLEDLEWKRKYRKEKAAREVSKKKQEELEKLRQAWKVAFGLAQFSGDVSQAQLSFDEGQIITILDSSNPDWWHGRIVKTAGRSGGFSNKVTTEGWVPRSYIRPASSIREWLALVDKLDLLDALTKDGFDSMASATLLTSEDLTDLNVDLEMAELMVEAIKYQEDLTKTLGVPPGWSITVLEEIKAVKHEEVIPGTQNEDDNVEFLGCFDASADTVVPAVPEPPSFAPPPVPGTEKRLKPGWETATEPSTGKIYYWNVNTNETSWEAPWDTPPAPAPAPAPIVTSPLTRERRDPSTSSKTPIEIRMASQSAAAAQESEAAPPVGHAKKMSRFNSKGEQEFSSDAFKAGSPIEEANLFADPKEKKYPYDKLKAPAPYPEDVDPKRREEYLDAGDFEQVFEMSYDDFMKIPKWKRDVKKKKMGLY